MLPLTASLVFSLKSNPSPSQFNLIPSQFNLIPSQFNLICNIKKKLKGGGNPLALYIRALNFEPKNFHLN